ncbi:MAG: hypothetical protein ACFFH0_12395 [Promethearchaeota archaeon]
MLLFLSDEEKEKLQKIGYLCEHLLCFYSMAADRTALFDGNFPVYFSSYNDVDVILFGLEDKSVDGSECVQAILQFPIKELNIVAPKPPKGLAGIGTLDSDWDYHINIEKFDIDLRGRAYKTIRSTLHRADKMNYHIKISREFTRNHIYIISRHMARHNLNVWDFEELLSLESFFQEHSHGFMMEAYYKDKLVGFDVVDFFDDNGIMVVPLGVYQPSPLLADFLMYENIKYAKSEGLKWLDVGLCCGNTGLQKFKEKWFAEPTYQLYIQTIKNSRYLPEYEAIP